MNECGAATAAPHVFSGLEKRDSRGRFQYRRPITRYILKRLGLSLISLFLLSILVFAMAGVLPGDPARNLLGREAPASQVEELNHQLGYDRPFVVRYFDWLGNFLRGDLGKSARNYPRGVSEDLIPALKRSLKLAALALVIIVPISIVGGVLAALRYGRPIDRGITVVGLSFAVIPEFVHGIVLVTIFGVGLHWFPTTAQSGSLKSLFLPACALALVLFGYIARMARAGTIEALDADYTRTAMHQGPAAGARCSSATCCATRCCRRSRWSPRRPATCSAASSSIEMIFNYPGIGQADLPRRDTEGLPACCRAAVLIVGVVYLVATLIADMLLAPEPARAPGG